VRTIKNQDGKLVLLTKPAIPVFVYDYFFFLPTFFAAFFLAAMFVTPDRFVVLPSALLADGVIAMTDWLYEEMPGPGNDYFSDIF